MSRTVFMFIFYTLIVKQEFRAIGIGQQLMKVSERWALEIGAINVLLNCGIREDRKVAKEFYQEIGYQIKSSGLH
ncbi:MAG: GNAT family N-acetyltransferase [Cytophagales bacterium]|nr:GNAT family N-acetyltransferase [Cytophagales bacterium]